MKVEDSTGCLAALVNLKRKEYPHLRILLSIGGGSGSQNFASVASARNKSERFCEKAYGFVDRYGLDGVDLDWEHPKTAIEGQLFVTLLAGLRLHLPAPRYALTAVLPAGEWCLNNTNLPRLFSAENPPILDMVNVMCYDFADPWNNGQSGHHAQLQAPRDAHNAFAKRSLAGVTGYLIEKQEVDPKEIVLTIPTYARAFRGVKGPWQTIGRSDVDGNGTIEYRTIKADSEPEKVDPELGAASCCTNDGKWLNYDTPETVRMKARFVKEQCLGGIFFWTGSYDAKEDDRSLVLAAAMELREAPNV